MRIERPGFSAWWRAVCAELRARLFTERIAKEIEDELALHVEMTVEQGLRDGLAPAQAQAEAMRRFGNLSAVRRRCRALKRIDNPPPRRQEAGMLSQLLRDVKYAVRNLIKNPGYTFAAIATLALGIGANAAIFSVVNGVLLTPFPYHDPERLVRLWENDRIRGTIREGFSGPDFFDVQERSNAFEGLSALQSLPYTVTGNDAEPARLVGTQISYDLFDLLGVQPQLGRGFYPDEDVPGAAPVAVLSHRLWAGRFGARSDITESDLTLEGERYRIVGVMPAGFAFPSTTTDFWTPLRISTATSFRGQHSLGVIARLADGVDFDRANASLETIAFALEDEYPDENLGRGMWAQSLYDSVVADVESPLLLLLGAVNLVLLIACVNVANLQLARGAARRQEVSVRAAMGAGRMTLVRQFLTESLVLTFFGGLAGLGIGYAGVRVLLALEPSNLPRLGSITVDARVAVFTLGVSVFSAMLFGLLPSLQAAKTDLQGALQEGGRGGLAGSKQRMRQLLVVSEIAMAVMLVTGSALLIRSFWKLTHVDPGFRPQGVYSTTLQLPTARYPQNRDEWPNWAKVRNFQTELVERVESLPNVQSASLAMNHPMNAGWTTRFQIGGREPTALGEQEEVRLRVVSPSYFETVGISVLQGRALTAFDDRGDAAPVILVNESFATRYFDREKERVLGSRVEIWGESREIVGIVRDVKFTGLDQEVPPALYPTFSQMPFTLFSLLVRTSDTAEAISDRIRVQVDEMDPDLAMTPIRRLDEVISGSVAQPRFNTLLLTIFAVLAMLLAAIGIYGVMAYGVSRRTREIGVRMSLGAQRSDVLRQFIAEGCRLAAIGIGVGLIASLLLTRTLSSLLFGVGAWDPAAFAAVCLVSTVIAVVASWLPARRASRTSPTSALRYG